MADPNSPQDPFEMFRRLWGPLGVPVPGMAMPTMDPKEIDKRVQELKSVEMWLSMNLNMLRTAIQGLEMQKATLAAFQSMQPRADPQPKDGAQPKPGAAPAPPPSAADAWWSLLQQMQNPPPAPKPDAKPEKKGK